MEELISNSKIDYIGPLISYKEENISKKIDIPPKIYIPSEFKNTTPEKLLRKESVQDSLPQILRRLETEKDPQSFKEDLLRAVQLYFDGLVENTSWVRNPKIWAEQEEALEAILQGVRMTVSGFYRKNKDVPFSDVREVVLPYDSVLIRHGSEKPCKYRHLFHREYEVEFYATSVAEAMKEKEVDLIIPVASGGFEPAALTADYLEVDQMFPIRFSGISRMDEKVLVPNQAPSNYSKKQIKGKNVLVVEDLIASGVTALKVVKWVRKYHPANTSFAAVIGEGLPKKCRLHRSEKSKHLYMGS